MTHASLWWPLASSSPSLLLWWALKEIWHTRSGQRWSVLDQDETSAQPYWYQRCFFPESFLHLRLLTLSEGSKRSPRAAVDNIPRQWGCRKCWPARDSEPPPFAPQTQSDALQTYSWPQWQACWYAESALWAAQGLALWCNLVTHCLCFAGTSAWRPAEAIAKKSLQVLMTKIVSGKRICNLLARHFTKVQGNLTQRVRKIRKLS